ncbi:MAG TPA: pyridoxamine 5'-phosphate oxidase family protein [Actinomycetota bacterium]|jgi:nitroimidazol reductase NimA-like FMN-containing flavoprotein (pyridoxamine 5'-phosphate oxidase superfamily)
MAEPPSERTRVRRLPERGVYDRPSIDAILDEALICHLAYVVDSEPRVTPTIHARVGDTLYVHGSNASRTLRATKDGAPVAVEVTLLDGLVMARSAFHHSMNYRSVMLYGRAREVTDPTEKWNAQRALVDHVAHGRAEDARMPNDRELNQTTILAVPIEEASAKVRTGPPKDEEEDLALPIWAGVLPLRTVPGTPEPDPYLPEDVAAPGYLTDYRR